MNFRVSARTILHLGSELISSDGVAFYELIKNSLDAKSTVIRVDLVYRLQFEVYNRIMRAMNEIRDDPYWLGPSGDDDDRGTSGRQRRNWHRFRSEALEALVTGAPGEEDLRDQLESASNRAAFVEALRSANLITISDNGTGMSSEVLENAFLTIGTSYRAKQKRSRSRRGDDHDDVILGEKGLGRLSSMRLGDRLKITTGRRERSRWNELSIDWNDFADAADADLDSVDVAPVIGGPKRREDGGTTIVISALRGEWTMEKLQTLAIEHFSRLVDPFRSSGLPLTITFNGTVIDILRFPEFLLEQAHGRLRVQMIVEEDGPKITGEMAYLQHRRRSRLQLSPFDLENLIGADIETLTRVGPFELDLYWFNRRTLTKIDGIGSLAEVRKILKAWAGGVALYRDGYRVNPYGGANDDWLDLDRNAFSTSGFKLNRGQIIGRALITQRLNPYLIDQTNREGLKDNPEKQAFVGALASVVELYRIFIVNVDRDVRRAQRVTAGDALERFRAEDQRVAELLPRLQQALRSTSGGSGLAQQIRSALDDLRDAANDLQSAADAQTEERERVMHLASIGLMIEILAHELYRATAAGLKTIAQARGSRDPASTGSSLRVLDSQLRTLQKRLKVLDPLSTSARQTKERFELVGWISEIVNGFASRNEASGVRVTLEVEPANGRLSVHAVHGMFVQVLENLLTNSLFWVTERHRYDVKRGLASPDDDEIGNIVVTVDTAGKTITVTDDGPGIPEDRREIVFQPFFTTRAQKEGRGLGLYIAREIAVYHNGALYLGEADHEGQIHSVIFEIGDVDVG
ncbi:hypothetical protein DXT91_24185 [Agrobacterium tumefaciens]|uniref:sensor histidine kinase n=1 Tax=Agrobacterium tumefaciens TaxID=358 RepID=UPI0012B843C9|nr:sensor histidine kinase [Agrobacterium tumefaciens]MQB07186.1 hypothetical protein [Agrobacterium tumefaciens]